MLRDKYRAFYIIVRLNEIVKLPPTQYILILTLHLVISKYVDNTSSSIGIRITKWNVSIIPIKFTVQHNF